MQSFRMAAFRKNGKTCIFTMFVRHSAVCALIMSLSVTLSSYLQCNIITGLL